MKNIPVIIILFFFYICNGQVLDENTNHQNVIPVNYDELKKALEQDNDKLLVVNFWATWCLPCIKELPDFMEINEKYKDHPDFKMILVSMDQLKNTDLVNRFLNKHSITTTVYLLNDNKNMNIWIPAIDPSWSGAIPATVFYKNGNKVYFKEEQINKSELDTLINSNL